MKKFSVGTVWESVGTFKEHSSDDFKEDLSIKSDLQPIRSTKWNNTQWGYMSL